MKKSESDMSPIKSSMADAIRAKRKFAKGGSVKSPQEYAMRPLEEHEMPVDFEEGKDDEWALPESQYMSDQFAEGGVVDRIIKKRKMMAEGGEVEGPEHDSEHPSDEWMKYEEAALKENFSSSGEHKQPMDSNEHGRDIDGDEHDMISSIRRKMKKRG